MSRMAVRDRRIKKLRKKGHHIKRDGSGIYEGVKFQDYYDKTTSTRYRVYEGPIPAPPQEVRKEIFEQVTA